MITLKGIFAVQGEAHEPHYLDDCKSIETTNGKYHQFICSADDLEIKNAFTESYSAT